MNDREMRKMVALFIRMQIMESKRTYVGASFSSAAATASWISTVGVRASINPPRPVPDIFAPTAPAARAARTRSSSSLQLTVSCWQRVWFSLRQAPRAAMSPASIAASPLATNSRYCERRLSNHEGSASFLARTSATTFVVEAVIPVLAGRMCVKLGLIYEKYNPLHEKIKSSLLCMLWQRRLRILDR